MKKEFPSPSFRYLILALSLAIVLSKEAKPETKLLQPRSSPNFILGLMSHVLCHLQFVQHFPSQS
jgi:hypothetical protein